MDEIGILNIAWSIYENSKAPVMAEYKKEMASLSAAHDAELKPAKDAHDEAVRYARTKYMSDPTYDLSRLQAMERAMCVAHETYKAVTDPINKKYQDLYDSNTKKMQARIEELSKLRVAMIDASFAALRAGKNGFFSNTK